MKAVMNKHAQSVLDTVLDRQKQAWLEGTRPSVEELLHDSSLPPDPEVLLDLLYNEIVLREELGEHPSQEDYLQRYPQLQEDLKVHVEVHRAMRENLLPDRRRVQDGESLEESEPISFEVGPKLADYEIVGELGRGGMGVVYKARHHRLKRLVALKMFQPGRMPSPRELTRFRSEAEAIARLQHPNIVQIFEVGQVDGLPFLALELAEKGTLAQKLQELPFTPRAAAELVETLARAIQHAHEQHIVHRDLKPANVLLAKGGTPKITDFGLAKILEEDADSPRDATQHKPASRSARLATWHRNRRQASKTKSATPRISMAWATCFTNA
jgi:serine/threonine protein kinase